MKKETKEINQGGCMLCPQTEDILPLNTVLYQGMGGYTIKKDGKTIFMEDCDIPWNKNTKLRTFECMAEMDENAKWTCHLDLPLRSAVWERKEPKKWVLIETGIGFA